LVTKRSRLRLKPCNKALKCHQKADISAGGLLAEKLAEKAWLFWIICMTLAAILLGYTF
jgi:hypothetical protein